MVCWFLGFSINSIFYSNSIESLPIISYGWLPVVQIHFIKLMKEKPEEKAIFGLIKAKYIPFCIIFLTFFTLRDANNIPIFVATAIGVL